MLRWNLTLATRRMELPTPLSADERKALIKLTEGSLQEYWRLSADVKGEAMTEQWRLNFEAVVKDAEATLKLLKQPPAVNQASNWEV